MSEIKQNDNLLLISGLSATGKSAGLMNMDNPEGVLYLNTEHKKLPFRSKFEEYDITDPLQIYEAFTAAEDMNHVHTIVIDTLTFLMDMYETTYVVTANDTRKAWGDYAQFFQKLMHHYVAVSTKNVIFLAHTREEIDEIVGTIGAKIPVKGSLNNKGIESYFSTIVSTKKVPIKELKDYSNVLLNISDEDTLLGYKYVYQTRLTKKTVAERMRSPMGMWSIAETYIDNDAQSVINRLHEFYS